MSVLATDGGPHPPEKWARLSAQQILDDIETNAPQTAVGEIGIFRDELEKILGVHHGFVQDAEREAIAQSGGARLREHIDPTPHLADVVDAIVEAAKKHTFADFFARPETQEYLRRILGSHFATSMHIERSWHADRNPGSEHAAAFRATHHGG